MHRISVRSTISENSTRTYSPIIMNNEWPAIWRLAFMISSTAIGTITNGFFVSSFFIENSLKSSGFVYLACTGLADMIITSGVIPAAAVVLISKVWELLPVCYSLQFLAQASTYTYNMLFLMVALETYMHLCRTRASYLRFLSVPVWFVSAMIFIISFVASGLGVYYGMDYDYCTRESYGNYTFRLITSLVFYGIPFTFTFILFFSTSLVVRARAIRLVHYKRSKQYDQDYAFTNLNFACYLLYVVAWLPYLVIVHKYPNTTDSKYYNCVWLGLLRSIFTSVVFSGMNSIFRRAFANLFYYCCCKSNMSTPYNHRHRRAYVQDKYYKTGKVKVHILHYNTGSSPQRLGRAGCSRDNNCSEI